MKNDILNSIVKDPHGAVLLLGREGCGVYNLARMLAEEILSYERPDFISLERELDFYLIDLEENKGEIRLEQVDIIHSVANVYPKAARCNVFIINHADRMNRFVQNSLLKVFEDSTDQNVFILCAAMRPIETICNRCMILNVEEPFDMEFAESIAEPLKTTADMIRVCVNGRKEWAKTFYDNGALEKILKMISTLITVEPALESKRQLLIDFDVLREKDTESFCNLYGADEKLALMYSMESVLMNVLFVNFDDSLSEVEGFYLPKEQLSSISRTYSNKKLMVVLSRVVEARDLIRRNVFNTNDLLEIIRLLVE